MSICVLCGEKRGLRNFVKGGEGWKPTRTATKSLGRQESLSAVAELQFLLMLGCWGRKERFQGLFHLEKKTCVGASEASCPLQRKMDSKEGGKLRWEYFMQCHGELCIKKPLMGHCKNKHLGSVALYLSFYNEETCQGFSNKTFIWEDCWGNHCTQTFKKGGRPCCFLPFFSHSRN